MRCSKVAKSNSVMVKTSVDGMNTISVPVRGAFSPAAPTSMGASPTIASGATAAPSSKRM